MVVTNGMYEVGKSSWKDRQVGKFYVRKFFSSSFQVLSKFLFINGRSFSWTSKPLSNLTMFPTARSNYIFSLMRHIYRFSYSNHCNEWGSAIGLTGPSIPALWAFYLIIGSFQYSRAPSSHRQFGTPSYHYYSENLR